MSQFVWIILAIIFAILLDLLIIISWRRYHQLLKSYEADNEKIKPRKVYGEAVRSLWMDFWRRFRKDKKDGQIVSTGSNSNKPGTRFIRWGRTYILCWPFLNLGLALFVMYAGQFLMMHIPKSPEWGVIIMVGGVLLAYFRQKTSDSGTFNKVDIFQIALGFLVCLPLALNLDGWMGETPPKSLIFLWLGAIIFVVTPLTKLSATPLHSDWPKVGSLLRWEKFVLLGLLIGGFLLRVIAVRDIPRPIDPDEASLGLFLINVAEGRNTQPFGTGWVTHPALQYFFLTPLVGIIRQPIVLMRMPSVIYGTLAISTFYLAARVGWGRRVALFSGILMMCSDISIHFSRLGVNNISDSLFSTWTIASLWTAASTGHPIAYVLTGVGMGLGQYYYFGNRALPFVVLATLAVWSLLNWRQFWRAWKLILAIFLVALIVAGPLIGLWIREPSTLERVEIVSLFFTKQLDNRAEETGESVTDLWWEHIRDSVLVFTAVPDQGSFYRPGRAMLPSILAPLFFIGLLALFRWRKKPASLGTLVWIIVILVLGSALINTAATFQRLLGLYPAVLLIIVLGLEASTRTLSRHFSSSKITTGLLSSIVIAIIAVVSLYFYFWVFNYQIVWKVTDQEGTAILAREYVDLQGEGTFVLNTQIDVGEDGVLHNRTMKLVAGPGIIRNLSQINLETDDRPIRIYFFYDTFDELSEVKDRYPGGTIQNYRRFADGEKVLIRYTIP